MTSAVYDYATVEKKMRHLEAANVFENVDSSHAIRGPRCGPSTETATSALSYPMGPCHKGGLRYWVNSVSLRVIHRDQLGSERYGDYVKFFTKQEV
ncbi:peptide methionine sulfoxide reductase MsrB [Bradyrhizobium sp. LA7.1]